jgi:ketosteroid isomerase-like protein
MTAQENIEKTKAAYAAFGAADIDAASAELADDIEWIVPGNSTVSGTYRGKDEVIGLWMTLAGKGFTTTPERFVGDDEVVVVLTSVSADGQTSDGADVLTFNADGKVVKFQTAGDTAQQEKIWGTKEG